MRNEFAQRVYPVLLKGLALKDRVLRGERPKLLATQTEFKRLLGSEGVPPWGSGTDMTRTQSNPMDLLLGFRGEKAREPERLRDWVSTVRSRITKTLSQEPPPIAETVPVENVPPLDSKAGYERMCKIVIVGVLASLPILGILLTSLIR